MRTRITRVVRFSPAVSGAILDYGSETRSIVLSQTRTLSVRIMPDEFHCPTSFRDNRLWCVKYPNISWLL